ncbi:hypothetical protein TRVL_04797 [Trypanosoma vivax]|nr:hypothetical protein TRVL_04797 [Trypanosoma vivax]
MKAQVTITEYRDLFNVLNNTGHQDASATVHQPIVAAERAIELAKSSETRALNVSRSAEESRNKIVDSYGSISPVVGCFSYYEEHAYLNYDALIGRLGKITVRDEHGKVLESRKVCNGKTENSGDGSCRCGG